MQSNHILALCLVIIATYLALKGVVGWGWFLFVAWFCL